MGLSANDLLKRMKKVGMDKEIQFAGCSEGEIGQMEAAFGVRFPESYRRYLSVFGKSSSNLFSDVIFVYPDILEFRENIPDRFGSFKPDNSHFVFLTRETVYLFFDTKDGDDPPVYRFFEDEDNEPKKVFDSFSDWLTDFTMGYVVAYEELNKS